MSCLSRVTFVAAACLLFSGPAAAVAPEIKDDGKFFSAEAVKKVNAAIREIYGKYGKDVLVETFPSVPADQVEKVKKMKGEELAKFFYKWAEDRAKARVVNGVYILVCKQPTRLETFITRKARGTLDSKFRKKLRETLLEEFRDKRFDEGLAAGVKLVKEQLAKAKSKD
jgi:uncharacterized membrane protein YgcG